MKFDSVERVRKSHKLCLFITRENWRLKSQRRKRRFHLARVNLTWITKLCSFAREIIALHENLKSRHIHFSQPQNSADYNLPRHRTSHNYELEMECKCYGSNRVSRDFLDTSREIFDSATFLHSSHRHWHFCSPFKEFKVSVSLTLVLTIVVVRKSNNHVVQLTLKASQPTRWCQILSAAPLCDFLMEV